MARQTMRRTRAAELRTPRDLLLQQLDDAVQQIIRAVEELEDPELVRVDEWSARDTLGHIAFWHESFARNVSALASRRQPDVLEGTYPELNQRGVEESRASSAAQIAERITRAQTVIRECILELPGDTRIPYRKGSRDYSPAEHLIIVRDHIHAHRHRIERARQRRR